MNEMPPAMLIVSEQNNSNVLLDFELRNISVCVHQMSRRGRPATEHYSLVNTRLCRYEGLCVLHL